MKRKLIYYKKGDNNNNYNLITIIYKYYKFYQIKKKCQKNINQNKRKNFKKKRQSKAKNPPLSWKRMRAPILKMITKILR